MLFWICLIVLIIGAVTLIICLLSLVDDNTGDSAKNTNGKNARSPHNIVITGMNRYRVTVYSKMGALTTFYMDSKCNKIKMLQLLSKSREAISILDTDDKIHIYPLDSVNYIIID